MHADLNDKTPLQKYLSRPPVLGLAGNLSGHVTVLCGQECDRRRDDSALTRDTLTALDHLSMIGFTFYY